MSHQPELVIFETQESHTNLLPLTFTRPVSLLRVGIDTLSAKWEAFVGRRATLYPVEYLRPRFGGEFDHGDALYVNGGVIADAAIADAAEELEPGTGLTLSDGTLLAYRGSLADFEAGGRSLEPYAGDATLIKYVFDVFLRNGAAIKADFVRLTKGRTSEMPSATNTFIGPYTDETGLPQLFLEPGAKMEGATVNLTGGPVYIGKDAEVMEGGCLRGPVALCEGARINMGAKIYADTTLGPCCKAGGEVNNVVFIGYSNKSHDGYLGNAVIGEWCNIGAGVNASNLKNDYSKIRIWNYATRSFMRTDLQFCGLIMGDHSKIGINCMLNTATVMGVGVNLHGSGFPRTFLPGFAIGSPEAGFKEVPLTKFVDIAERVMERRGLKPSEADLALYAHLHSQEEK